MSLAVALFDWLEDKSDRLSPIVVKEVRQAVRGREFHYSFVASLIVALMIAFYGAAAAPRSDGTTGAGTFTALMVCLTLLGLLVVPIGAFSAMRAERMEQTLELVTVTALSSRRVVIGTLMAQAVKLVTLFAALAPFMAMSFLLGGIDFLTILISLAVLFLWSLWAASAFLFLSTLFKSRAMSGVVLGAAGILMFFVATLGRFATFGFGIGPPMSSRAAAWWALAMVMTGCVATTANLVLLAESRLTVPTANRVTPLRIGFFAQFMLIVAWALTYLGDTYSARTNAAEALAVIGGLHLAIVAMFTVTEDPGVPRRVRLEMQKRSRWDWLLMFVRPGGGRGAAYVLAQMVLLVMAVFGLDPTASTFRWSVVICAYICFFTGVPPYLWRRLRPNREAAFQLRVIVLVFVALATVLPDVTITSSGARADASFRMRHLVSPFRTLANWDVVESSGWMVMPALLGLAGLLSYAGLMQLEAQSLRAGDEPERAAAAD